MSTVARRALRRPPRQTGESGLAHPYVTGDLPEGLRTRRAAQRERDPRPPRPPSAHRAHTLVTAVRLGAVGHPPSVPASQARLRGGLHSRARDRAAVSHHYDLSDDFHGLLLDETMAHSCGSRAGDEPEFTAVDAQRAEPELICREPALESRARMPDIGCGWRSLAPHAAERHGAQVTAATLAREQAAYARERGLTGLVEGVCRGIRGGGHDAVSAVEMGEHVGAAEYPAFATAPHRLVRLRVGAFIEEYLAPDMHMRHLGETVMPLEETVRVWRLCPVGAVPAFEEGRMGVDQILAVRPGPVGAAGMPSTSSAWCEGL